MTSIEIGVVLALLAQHFIVDWHVQSLMGWGTRKTEPRVLTLHVATITAGLALLIPLGATVWWVLLNGALHGVTDFFTSRLNAWAVDRWGPQGPVWHIIAFDQHVHLATALLTWGLV